MSESDNYSDDTERFIECNCGRVSSDTSDQIQHLLDDHDLDDWEQEQAGYKLRTQNTGTEQ